MDEGGVRLTPPPPPQPKPSEKQPAHRTIVLFPNPAFFDSGEVAIELWWLRVSIDNSKSPDHPTQGGGGSNTVAAGRRSCSTSFSCTKMYRQQLLVPALDASLIVSAVETQRSRCEGGGGVRGHGISPKKNEGPQEHL